MQGLESGNRGGSLANRVVPLINLYFQWSFLTRDSIARMFGYFVFTLDLLFSPPHFSEVQQDSAEAGSRKQEC